MEIEVHINIFHKTTSRKPLLVQKMGGAVLKLWWARAHAV